MADFEGNFNEKIGERAGYLASYLLFTTILFFVLKLSNKMPESWDYTNVMLITFIIALIGVIIKRLLK